MAYTFGMIMIVIGVVLLLIGIFVGSENSVALGGILGVVLVFIGVYSFFSASAAGFAFIGGGFGLAIVRQKRSCIKKNAQWCADHPTDPLCHQQQLPKS